MSKEHFILVVDDDEAIREALTESLRDEGHEVASAANGLVALELLRARPGACLIFLDLMMPVMDGWEFRREQLQDPTLAGIPVCVISAAGVTATSDLAAGCFFPKPFDLDQLLQAAEERC